MPDATIPLFALPFDHASPAELLRARANERPDHEALVWRPLDGGRLAWTYGDLIQKVDHVAAGLRDRGIEAGDFVCIHANNCPQFILAWFALNRIGAALVSTNARSTAAELSYYLDRARCRLVITQQQFADVVVDAVASLSRDVEVLWIDRDDDDDAELLRGDREGEEAPSILADPLAIAGVQFTSGTTSRPKGVVWTNANYVWGGRVSASHEVLAGDDRHLVHLPLFHTNAQIYSVMASIWAGATIILLPRFSASQFWPLAIEERATWSAMIPFSVKALRDHPVPDHYFRAWGNGIQVPRWDERFKVTTVAWWGMTETVSHPIVSDPRLPSRALSMGMPAPEYRVRVVGADGEVLEHGEGLLEVLGVPGVSMMLGYLDDESATAASYTSDGWLVTGDRVRLHTDGWFSFVERDKDMLKVGGENVAALEIEQVIGAVRGVREVAVVARPDAMLEQVPVAFVLALEFTDRTALRDMISVACRTALADFKQPREVRIVDNLPRSTLEKVAKAELRRWAVDGVPSRPETS